MKVYNFYEHHDTELNIGYGRYGIRNPNGKVILRTEQLNDKEEVRHMVMLLNKALSCTCHPKNYTDYTESPDYCNQCGCTGFAHMYYCSLRS